MYLIHYKEPAHKSHSFCIWTTYIHVPFYAVDFIAALLNKNRKSLSQNGAKKR